VRDEAAAKQDPAFGLASGAPWRVSAVGVLPGHRLHVRFVDGTEGEVDASHLVFSEDAGVFKALRDPQAFAQVTLVDGAVTWPGDIDMAPDAMYDEIRANGRWVIP
jgi:uncharacterized protein DUF2442